ncbi:hypothetical protein [Streptomyces sp. NPDC000888]
MTQTQHLVSISSGFTKALRLTTRVLRLVGDHTGTVAVWTAAVGVVVWMANDVAGFAPVLDRFTAGDMILLLLALAGGITLVEAIAFGAANALDPDARDGDDLWDAVQVINRNLVDISQGADYDDVRIALQTSGVLPALHALTTSLRDEYANDGEMEEASALSDTTALIRSAAESFGHRDLGQ